jgi:uncharacterized membrane protein
VTRSVFGSRWKKDEQKTERIRKEREDLGLWFLYFIILVLFLFLFLFFLSYSCLGVVKLETFFIAENRENSNTHRRLTV